MGFDTSETRVNFQRVVQHAARSPIDQLKPVMNGLRVTPDGLANPSHGKTFQSVGGFGVGGATGSGVFDDGMS